MKNIIANFVRGGGKPLSYLLAAGLTFAAAQSAQAKMWKGNGSDTLWSTPENWENSTVPAATDSLAFRQSGAPNKTATLNGAYSYTGNMHMGQGSSAAEPYIFVATDAANGLTINDDVWLGYYENGWLWLKSGTYTFGVSSGKGLSLGGDTKTTHRNFWLKVGDGSSTVSLKATARDVNLWGGSTFIADKATLDFAVTVPLLWVIFTLSININIIPSVRVIHHRNAIHETRGANE